MRRTTILPLSLFLLPACGDSPGAATDAAGTSTTDGSSSSGLPTTGEEAAAVTYHRDIKPILDSKCVGCHSPGNVGPFSLHTHADASAVAAALPASVLAGTMPPWPPDNGCRSYQHDRSLSAEQQQAIAEWVELGAPEGDPADAPPEPAAPAPIDYNIELQLPEPYTPTIVPDEYRCFLLPWPEDQDTFITALTVTPGERQLVHHVIAFAIPPDQVADYQALDEADPDPGYLCYGGPSGGKIAARAPWLGAWVPGGASGAMPEGTGLPMQPGSLVAVQMHYHSYPGAGPDQSKLQLRTATSVDRVAAMIPFANPGWPTGTEPMTIPAGEPDVVHSFELDVSGYLPTLAPDTGLAAGQPFVIHNASLHMHTIGARASLAVTGDQDTCVLDIPRWDFNWQGSYALTEPVTVHPGDKLRLECHYDNSKANQPFIEGVQQEPVDIGWGEGTGDEMCLGIFYITGE